MLYFDQNLISRILQHNNDCKKYRVSRYKLDTAHGVMYISFVLSRYKPTHAQSVHIKNSSGDYLLIGNDLCEWNKLVTSLLKLRKEYPLDKYPDTIFNAMVLNSGEVSIYNVVE
jgi:hypothetical protein